MTIGKWFLLGFFVLVVILAAVNRAKLASGWSSIQHFSGEVRLEMKKVSWPTREHVMGSTVLVGVTTLMLVILVGVVDRVFGQLVALIFTN